MGDTEKGSWNSDQLLGHIRREEARKEPPKIDASDTIYDWLSERLQGFASKLSLEDQTELDGIVSEASKYLDILMDRCLEQTLSEEMTAAIEAHGRN